jgi:DNA-binding response OmpR family regulator
MAKILIIDDDKDLTLLIRSWLSSENHVMEIVHNGREGMDLMRGSGYDLILLDWDLPEMTGIDVLRTFKNERGTTPIIMLTGNRTVDEKESGLNSGADDYLTKPFHMKELSARIKAVLRRSSKSINNVLEVADMMLDPVKYKFTKGGREIVLVPKEFALLEFLMRHPGQVFDAETLLQRVWHSDSEATIEAVRTCIRRMRQKIDANEENSVIETIARVGYRLRP